jgi:hypothetical protein
MASTTHTVSSTSSSSSPSVQKFAESVLSLRNNFATDALWARHHSRAYFHDVSNTPGFLPVYHILLNTASSSSPANSNTTSNPKSSRVTPSSTSTSSTLTFEKDFDRLAEEEMKGVSLNTAYEINSWAGKLSEKFYKLFGETKSRRAGDIYLALLNKVAAQKKSSSTRSSTPLTFEKDFHRLADEELKDLKNHESVASWARVNARKMYHTFNGQTPFVDIYMGLVSKAVVNPKTNSTASSNNKDESKNIVNRTLWGEYETWYDAFEQEAKEDPEGPDADTRWTHHVSKILARRLKSTPEAVIPSIQKWLAKQ